MLVGCLEKGVIPTWKMEWWSLLGIHIFQHDYNLCIRHLLGLTLLAMEVLWKLIYPRVVFQNLKAINTT